MTARKAKPAPKPATPLPPDVTADDLKYPLAPKNRTGEYNERWMLLREEIRKANGGMLTFYHVPAGRKAPEWVLTTLRISGGGARGTTDRYYAIGLADGKLYTVGSGPHVTAVVTVYLHPNNWDRLQKYADLWVKGMAEAGAIRDQISSRRMQGQMRRASFGW